MELFVLTQISILNLIIPTQPVSHLVSSPVSGCPESPSQMEFNVQCCRSTKKYISRVLECQRLVQPVLVNMLLTVFCWVQIYDMKVDEKLAVVLFGNLGESVWDALLNGLCSSLMLISVAFIMLAFALWDLRRVVQFWLYASCVLLLFLIAGNFFQAVIFGPEVEMTTVTEAAPVILATAVYGLVGLATYFTNWLPEALHRYYVIVNCSLVSLYYLRCLPGHTTWVVLVAVALWDIFAVLSPYGPLNVIQSKAKDYGAEILRFLMYSAGDSRPQVDIVTAPASSSDSNTSSCSTASSSDSSSDEEESTVDVETKMTAEDALNDTNFKLGMGDFVFFGLLVGKSAASESVLATAGCFAGIIYGLIVTLVFFSSEDKTTPALPISIFLGILFHLAGLQMEPILVGAYHALSDLVIFGL